MNISVCGARLAEMIQAEGPATHIPKTAFSCKAWQWCGLHCYPCCISRGEHGVKQTQQAGMGSTGGEMVLARPVSHSALHSHAIWAAIAHIHCDSKAMSPSGRETTASVPGFHWSLTNSQSPLLMQVIIPFFSGGELWVRLLKRTETVWIREK